MIPRWLSGRNSKEWKRLRFNPWIGDISWRREWQTTPVFLPGKSHGQRSLEGYSPWGPKESDMTEWLNNRTTVCGNQVQYKGGPPGDANTKIAKIIYLDVNIFIDYHLHC